MNMEKLINKIDEIKDYILEVWEVADMFNVENKCDKCKNVSGRTDKL